MSIDANARTVCPLISVVIPTRGRPELVVRAVESALAQTYTYLEVLVVIDGPDPATEDALARCEDKRLRLLSLEENAGGSEARNIGVRAAQGEWVAFLDDDDRWLPEKLEKQFARAMEMSAVYPVVSSRLLARGRTSERLQPRFVYVPGGDVSEYLFCRRGFSYGDGMLQTSTLLVKRALLLEVPFLKGLKQHQDWDWLLKVARRTDVAIAMLPETLTIMQTEEVSVSRTADWRSSLAWVRANHNLMTPKAFAFFITTECVPRAKKQGAKFSALMGLLGEILKYGDPGVRQMLLFVFFCVVPERRRRELRDVTMQRVTIALGGAIR